MKERIKEIQTRIDNDPRLKRAVTSLKPKKSIWGVMGIILFFFVPELAVYIWQDELVSWAHQHAFTEPLAMQRWLYGAFEEMFKAGVSWVNVLIGTLLLVWVLR